MRKTGILLSFGFYLLSCLTYAQTEIDLSHKIIGKELKKQIGSENYQLQKLKFEDTDISTTIEKRNFYRLLNDKHTLGYLYVGRVNSCRATGCSVTAEREELISYEYFDYMILFDTSCSIKSVRVFNYQATHGHEICARSWLKQFTGYSDESNLSLNNTVDAISGATVSVMSIISDIEKASSQLTDLLKKQGTLFTEKIIIKKSGNNH